MNFDYVSLRRLERFFTDLKAWLASKYATKEPMTGATAQSAGETGLVPAPAVADKDKYLKGDGTWSTVPVAQKSTYGNTVGGEEEGVQIIGEGGESLDYENAVELYDTYDGTKFGAARAVADREGNVFDETYVKSINLPIILAPYAAKLIPETKSAAATVTVSNNKVTSISGVTGSIAIDIDVASGECANTAVELTTGSSVTADSAVTVTVNGVAAGRAAATDGKISASKKYQVTCVGTCWTMAEFETTNA